nr:hypothetical protein Iba_chr06fCG7350 [Ipomoea batatas]
MNSKTLSNVRTAEALDQIQRDTKKTKHIPGDPGTSAMEITEEEAASEGIGSQTIESIEVVAETPLENQKAMEYSAKYSCEILSGYGGELGDSDRTNALEEPDQNQVATHTVTNVGGEAVAWPSTKGAHPYGSWMIATRRERRQQGGQGDCPNEGAMQRATNGKGKGGATGTGSRFALLENAEENEGPEPQVEAEATGNPTTDSRAKGLGGKSKRANVIVNENKFRMRLARHAWNQRQVRSRRDSNGADVPEAIPSDSEHHEDPPSSFDHEGDVIMDDDSPQAVAEAAGGDKCPAL